MNHPSPLLKSAQKWHCVGLMTCGARDVQRCRARTLGRTHLFHSRASEVQRWHDGHVSPTVILGGIFFIGKDGGKLRHGKSGKSCRLKPTNMGPNGMCRVKATSLICATKIGMEQAMKGSKTKIVRT